MNIKRINILFSLLVLLCLSTSGCGESKLFSSWRERTINIDGKYTDWSQSSAYYDERRKVVLNLVNDADYLYICLISRNRAIETKIMESGFTIWFDPDGRQKKVFGIRFPTGLRRMGISIDEEKRDIEKNWRDQEDKSGLIDRDKERLKDKNFNKRLETLEGLQDKLEIIKRDTDLKGKNKQPKPPAEEADKIGAAKDKGMAPVDFRKDRPVEFTIEEARKFGYDNAKLNQSNANDQNYQRFHTLAKVRELAMQQEVARQVIGQILPPTAVVMSSFGPGRDYNLPTAPYWVLYKRLKELPLEGFTQLADPF
ncbi:MAG: hypothetical protein NTW13_00345, partial [Candidatus Omnitrophica bacterium]|nr:hypothetical protein [Candidatus Omnitrophota bacterium]